MNDTVIYRPYKTQTWALVFTLPVGILAFVGVGYSLPLSSVSALFLTGVGIANIWFTKESYDSSKKAIFFDKSGLRFTNGSCSDYRHIPWSQVPYACYVRDFKGHLLLILSPNALSIKEARRLVNWRVSSSRICIDSAVVIYIDILQDVSQLRELIDNQVLRVDTY